MRVVIPAALISQIGSAMRKGILGALAVSLLTGAIVGAGVVTSVGPAVSPYGTETPSVTPYPEGWTPEPLSWGTTPATNKTPVSKRKVYVISTLKGWPVSSAMAYVDIYTGSDWVMARSCPSGAYRCIFVKRDDRLSAPTIAATYSASGSRVTIKVDVAYAARKGITSSRKKKFVLAHELVHAAGVHTHSSTQCNLMHKTTGCWSFSLNSAQKAIMRRS